MFIQLNENYIINTDFILSISPFIRVKEDIDCNFGNIYKVRAEITIEFSQVLSIDVLLDSWTQVMANTKANKVTRTHPKTIHYEGYENYIHRDETCKILIDFNKSNSYFGTKMPVIRDNNLLNTIRIIQLFKNNNIFDFCFPNQFNFK